MSRLFVASFTSASLKKARGFTLTELAIVLGVMGIILAGIWVAASAVYANNRTKTAMTEVATIISNWQTVYANKPLDLASGADMGSMTATNNFAPSEMLPINCAAMLGGYCTFNGPWANSAVTMSADNVNNAIAINYQNLSRSACDNLANAIKGMAGLISLNVTGQTTELPPLVTTPATTSLTSTIIDGFCVTGNTNYVIGEFSMH